MRKLLLAATALALTSIVLAMALSATTSSRTDNGLGPPFALTNAATDVTQMAIEATGTEEFDVGGITAFTDANARSAPQVQSLLIGAMTNFESGLVRSNYSVNNVMENDAGRPQYTPTPVEFSHTFDAASIGVDAVERQYALPIS